MLMVIPKETFACASGLYSYAMQVDLGLNYKETGAWASDLYSYAMQVRIGLNYKKPSLALVY